MRSTKVRLILAVLLGFMILLTACSRNQPTTVPVEGTTPPQETSVTPQEGATQGPGGTTSPSTTGVPADVPIMPDAYELKVANEKNLTYKVNAKIEDVVAFYQEEFPKYGWDVKNNPDSVVGSMAQIARSNSAGDRLVFSIQYNPVGEFSVVQIFITR